MVYNLATSVVTEQDLQAIAENLKQVTWEKALPAVIIVIAGIILIRLLMKIFRRLLEKTDRIEKTLHTFILSAVRVFLVVILVVIVASQLGIDMSAILVVIGVLVLAFSMAAEGILSNIASGLMILISRPFNVGDLIEVEDTFGMVEQITFNYIKVRLLDKKAVYIPNKNISVSKLKNYINDGIVRVEVDVEASYNSRVEDVTKALMEASDIPCVLKDPERSIAITNYGDNAIKYQLRMFVKPEDYGIAKGRVMANIHRTFEENNVEFTYPHIVVHNSDR
ncbi:MAG: mechanosensitive ion channel family protein [Parasporobacterium sp.]|nr:mechanosensitive ion channel family protein [Parasporobacterium sp.]